MPEKFLGTTKRGIGPTYAAKALRAGIRVGDLLNWDQFLTKYDSLTTRFREQQGLVFDTQRELKQLKEYRDILIANGMIKDTIQIVNRALKDGKRVLTEGANATMLDLDYGTYPYVTSSSTNIGGVCTGLGIAP
jgi:adenylosuccinate synthase